MIKNVTVAVTNKCNSRCIMCNIWKTGITKSELSSSDFKKLFSLDVFNELEDLNISGGEALLREDLFEIVDGIIENKKLLRMLFLSTNGTLPYKASAFVKRYIDLIEKVFICVSIEGAEIINSKIRGIDSFSNSLKTIELCKRENNSINTIISTTLTPYNSSIDNLQYLINLAKETESTLSFRLGWNNDYYYHNNNIDLKIDKQGLEKIIPFIKENFKNEPFMAQQILYFEKGIVPIMQEHDLIKCKAGDVFIFIKPDGTIFPCINSNREIGSLNKKMKIEKIQDLGKFEQCPCCTECCIWPMINFSSYSSF